MSPMAANPLVSIVVPSFRQGAFIRETIDSILTQDYRPLEVLVLDGGSQDETVPVLQSYDGTPELQWWSEPDRGVVDAVNKGLARARGEIIGIQSSDDLYLPGAVTAAVHSLIEDDLALVYGDIEYIDSESRVTDRTHLPPFDLNEYAGKLTFIPQPAAFFTAAAARAAGGWREDVSYAADAEFYLRVATRGKTKKIDRLLARYRYHDAQRDKAGGSRIARDWELSIAPLTESPDPILRRHARGGIHLTRHHYLPEEDWVRRTVEVYRAIAANPALLCRPEIRAIRELLPGRYPLFRMLSRIKRALGLKPRGT